jgi:hypothetical protein
MSFNHLETLKAFNERAGKLLENSFYKNSLSSGTVFLQIDKKIIYPYQESLEAFILTFRFFIQDNDLSIRKLASIYKNDKLSEELRNKFNTERTKFNKCLDGESIKINDLVLDRRAILETFIYGHYAHSNSKLKKQFENCTSEQYGTLWHFEFIKTLLKCMEAIKGIEALNKLAIEECSC